MAHRVEQIVDAIATILRANTNLRATVETHRVRSVAEFEGEIPLVCVNYGADQPDDEEQLGAIASVVELFSVAYCDGESEIEVLTTLLELRRQVHIALMADPTLGLAFVWQTEYGGADRPDIQQAGRTVGALSSRWLVHYVMNIADPQ